MKRLILLLLIASMVLALFGCGGQNTNELGTAAAGNAGNIGKEPAPQVSEKQEPQDQPSDQPEQSGGGAQVPSNGNQAPSAKPEVDLSGEAGPDEEEIDYTAEGWITVCSYNIKALYNTETSKMDVPEVLRKIDADVVGMQEVDHRLSFTGQVQYLAEQLGYSYYYFAMCEEADSEGHGIMSRYRIKSYKEVSYKFQQGEPRKYTRAVLDINGQDVAFYNTHLTTGTWQQTGYQFEELLQAIYKEKIPVILTGDFNLSMVEQEKRVDTKKLLPLNGLHDMSISHPWVRWDNIYITEKDFEYYVDYENLVGIQSMDTNASDHKPIWTHIRLRNQT